MKLFLTSHNLEQKHFDCLMQLLGKQKVRRALFITAAAVPYGLNPKPDWLVESQEALKPFADSIDETSLENTSMIPDKLSEYGFVFVSGGNTFYLAYRLNETGLDKKLREYIEGNSVYVGSSAGSIVLMDKIKHFATADDPKAAPELHPGLNIIKQAIIPHVDSDKYRKIVADIGKKYENDDYEVVMLNDNQVFVVDGESTKVI